MTEWEEFLWPEVDAPVAGKPGGFDLSEADLGSLSDQAMPTEPWEPLLDLDAEDIGLAGVPWLRTSDGAARTGLGMMGTAMGMATGAAVGASAAGSCAVPASELEQRIAEAEARGEASGFARGQSVGREAGLAEGHEEVARILAEMRQQGMREAAELAADFDEERQAYFHQAEQELVRLALAVAAVVLRREAALDPLLLSGAVRVALSQLSGQTTVRVRVPAAEEKLWRETLAVMPGITVRPRVVADERLATGECRMETELGTAELSVAAQMAELERVLLPRVAEIAGRQHRQARQPQPDNSGRASRDQASSGMGRSGMGSIEPDNAGSEG